MTDIDVVDLYTLAMNDEFQGAVLIGTLNYAHEIMNQEDADPKLKAKAFDIINQPEQYKQRLALNAVTRLDRAKLTKPEEGGMYLEGTVTLGAAIHDMFDALAGVGTS